MEKQFIPFRTENLSEQAIRNLENEAKEMAASSQEYRKQAKFYKKCRDKIALSIPFTSLGVIGGTIFVHPTILCLAFVPAVSIIATSYAHSAKEIYSSYAIEKLKERNHLLEEIEDIREHGLYTVDNYTDSLANGNKKSYSKTLPSQK